MTPDAMTAAQRAIHCDGPVRARYVVEVEILETEHGTVAEIEVRAHTWTDRPIHVDAPTLAATLPAVGPAIADSIRRHGGID